MKCQGSISGLFAYVECGPRGQAGGPACQDIPHGNRRANSQRSTEVASRRIHQAYPASPRWLSNIVPVKKKNGQIRCCVDFRNLNKACPKDEFPLPNMDLLIDSAARNAMFSFMDGFSGYNQIKMEPKDAEKTAFRTPMGNFYYTVIPFGLKNAGATYQRAMTAIFHDMMH